MTAVMSAPLAVFDVRESWPPPGLDRFLWWLRENGIDDMATYRIEIYSTDHRFVRVFQYDRRPEGGSYVDPETGDVAKREPFDVQISSMPPISPPPRKGIAT